MLLKSILTMSFSLVASVSFTQAAHAAGRSNLDFGSNCQLQGEGQQQCLVVNRPCTVIGSLVAGKGRNLRNKNVSFGVGGGWPHELGYNEYKMITKTNSAGKAKITLNPISATKGRNVTVVFMPAELGGRPAFRYSKLDFQLCE